MILNLVFARCGGWSFQQNRDEQVNSALLSPRFVPTVFKQPGPVVPHLHREHLRQRPLLVGPQVHVRPQHRRQRRVALRAVAAELVFLAGSGVGRPVAWSP